MKTVVIDPGHGGVDPGAVNGARLEKNDNLRLGLAVQRALAARGYNAILTRAADTTVTLEERSMIANRADADLMVSLHRNAAANPRANGVENWVQSGSPEKDRQYAQNVLRQVVQAGVQSDRGVRDGNFSVLRNTLAPSMLLEMGFISNTEDNRLFDSHLEEYAQAIAEGVEQSLGGLSSVTSDPVMKTIQQTLNTRYQTGLETDGIFGPATRRAMIIGLQIELNRLFGANLMVDGILGNKTKAAIPNLRVGSRGDLVWLLQAALHAAGSTLTLDGIFGPGTERVVREYQRENGLVADGIAGPETISSLLRTPA